MINPSISTLINLFVCLVCFWHWVACVYYYLATDAIYNYDIASYFGGGMWAPPQLVMERQLAVRYVYCFYWAVGITCQVSR